MVDQRLPVLAWLLAAGVLGLGSGVAHAHGGGGHGGGGGHAIGGVGGFRGGGFGGFGGFRGGFGYGYGGFYGYPWFGYGLGLGMGYGMGYGLGGYGYGYPNYGYGYGGGYPVCVNVNTGYGAPPGAYPPPGSVAGQGPPPGTPGGPPLRLTDTDVLLSIRVPPDAVVRINGEQTTQNGPRREFMSSGLSPGRTYTFVVTARWSGPNGKPEEHEERVHVQGGERRNVDFLKPLPPPREFPPIDKAGS